MPTSSLMEMVEDLHALGKAAKNASAFNKVSAATSLAEKSLEVVEALALRVIELEKMIKG